MLTWLANCVINNSTNPGKFTIVNDAKHYVPIATLSTQNNTKLLEQLNPGFKRTINWNKYQLKVIAQAQKKYLDYLIDPSFQ